MKIKSKYSVGDTVYYSGLISLQKKLDCPDCFGEERWTTTSPAGIEYWFDCPRCSSNYLSDRKMSLSYLGFKANVEALTIGSVRFDSSKDDGKYTYMCKETGVGSGTVYDQDDLFLTRDEATNKAERKADDQEKSNPSSVAQYAGALSVCDYQLHLIPAAGDKQK
jgi:hypothetical protein